MFKKCLLLCLITLVLWGQEQYVSYHELYWEYEAQNLLVSGMVVHHDSEKGIYWWDNEGPYYLLNRNGLRLFFDPKDSSAITIDQIRFNNCEMKTGELSKQIVSNLPQQFSDSHSGLMEEDPGQEPPSGTYNHNTERTYLLLYGGGTIEVGVSSDGNGWAAITSYNGDQLVVTTESSHKYARVRNQNPMVEQTQIMQQICYMFRAACSDLTCHAEAEALRVAQASINFENPDIDFSTILRNVREVARRTRSLQRCERAQFNCNMILASCDALGF